MHICVEIKLKKRCILEFKLLNKVYHVEYEGLHFICFKCGKYGHKKELGPEKCMENVYKGDQDANVRKIKIDAFGNNNMLMIFRPWMIV